MENKLRVRQYYRMNNLDSKRKKTKNSSSHSKIYLVMIILLSILSVTLGINLN